MINRVGTFLMAAILVAAIPASAEAKRKDYSQYLVACTFETNVKGSYSLPAGAKSLPTVVPKGDGTEAGAKKLNQCMQAKTGEIPASTAQTQAQAQTPAPASSGTRKAQTIEDQRSAILECKRKQRVGGPAWIQQRRYASGSRMSAQIIPYGEVHVMAADAINACAAAMTGLEPVDGSVVSRKRTVVRSIRAPYGYRGADCGRNPSILYKGDLYCQWAKR